MSDLEDQIRSIRSQIDEMTRRVARAEFEREAAGKAKKEALQVLGEYGCKNTDDAQRMLQEMELEMQQELVRVQQALESQ